MPPKRPPSELHDKMRNLEEGMIFAHKVETEEAPKHDQLAQLAREVGAIKQQDTHYPTHSAREEAYSSPWVENPEYETPRHKVYYQIRVGTSKVLKGTVHPMLVLKLEGPDPINKTKTIDQTTTLAYFEVPVQFGRQTLHPVVGKGVAIEPPANGSPYAPAMESGSQEFQDIEATLLFMQDALNTQITSQ